MANIYQQIITNAANVITKANNRELSSEEYKENVFNSVKIKIPKVHLDQIKIDIKAEEISYRNAPPEISFSVSGSKIVEYAIYIIPVSGDMELFGYIIRPYINRRTTYIQYNNLYYKEYSNNPISGNDDLINEIKNRVVNFINNVNSSLKQFEGDVENFHETKLKPIIDTYIQSEIAKRNLTSDSISKLNPFT